MPIFSSKKPALIFIFITLLIDVMGFGLIIPVMPGLLAELKGISINEASKYGGYLLCAFAITQLMFSPIVGGLSDRYGRRPILLISLLGFGIDYIILALAPTYEWFFIGRIMAGITGASFTTAAAYIADISTPETRTQNFGLIGAAFGLGFIIGPFLGGVIGEWDIKYPFYAAASLSFVNFIYGFLILPESLPLSSRRTFDIRRANPFGTLLQLSKYNKVKSLLLAFTFLYLGSHAVQSVWSYFTMYQFNWNEGTVGLSLAFVGILVALVQTVVAKKVANVFGIERSIVMGFFLYAVGMFLFSVANSTWMMFVFSIPYCLGGIAMPNIQSFMASQIAPNQQGELQGGLTSLVSLTTVGGPILMTFVFYYFTSPTAPVHLPGASFLLGGVFMSISFLITYNVG